MKLTDLLKEIEDEQGGEQKSMRVQYDIAIQPKSIDDALAALNDIKNYGIYSKNLANQADRIKIFGPSIPAQKSNAAQNDWNSLSPKERLLKIEEIKSRIERKSDFKGNVIYDKVGEKAWNNTLDLLSKNKDYLSWKEENKDNPEEYLITLNGKQANNLALFGSRGRVYFPQKLGDEEAKYKPLQQDVHYIVDSGMILFPQDKSPFHPKSYLKKVLKTIMDNAGLEYKFADVEKEGAEDDTPVVSTKPEKPTVPPLSTTVNTADQADKLRKIFQKRLGDVPGAKYEVESTGTGAERKYKLVVTGISADQRAKLQPLAFDFKQNLKESLDFERRQMLVRAGIIK